MISREGGGPPCYPLRVQGSFRSSSGEAYLSPVCHGCGAQTQARDPEKTGYVPELVLSNFSGGWRKRDVIPRGVSVDETPHSVEVNGLSSTKYRSKATMLYCQRCFRLQNYRRIDPTMAHLPLFGKRSTGEQQHSDEVVEHIVTRVKKDSVVIKVVDVLDFETSLVPELYEAFSRRGIKVITVLNKMDCLPMTSEKWPLVLQWSTKISKILRSAIGPDGKKDVVPVSSVNEAGFDVLESRLARYMSASTPKSIYVVGRTNSGKSTFVTRFLRYIGYKHMGCVHYKRSVGGVTRSPAPSTTLNFIRFPLPKGSELIDTPGVTTKQRITSHLSTHQDFQDVSPGRKLQPLTYALKDGKALLIGAMCRIEVVGGSSALVTCFVSPKVTLHICSSSSAPDLLRRKAGTFLYPPHLDVGDTASEHKIASAKWVKHRVEVFAGPSIAHDDISIAGLGWLSISGQGHKEIDVWVPEGVKVFRRPALLPSFIQTTGSTGFHFRHRARGHSINRKKKELIRSMRVVGRKEKWRTVTRAEQEENLTPPEEPSSSSVAFVDDGVLKEYEVHHS